MITYEITFATQEDADAAMVALENASMEGNIVQAFEIQLVMDQEED